MAQLTRILCAIDLSPDSHAALRAAAAQARQHDAVLVRVHAWHPPFWLTESDYSLPSKVVQETIETSEATLEAWQREARELGAPEVVTHFVTGVPWDQIVAMAREDPRIGLIVVGTHGRTGLKRALLGSVSEMVVRHAPCTVMVVRGPDEVSAPRSTAAAGADPRAPAAGAALGPRSH